MNRAERVAMVDRGHADLSVRRQCALLGLARSGVYRQPAVRDPEELALMRWLDEQYLATPFYGSRRMTVALRLAGIGSIAARAAADGPRSAGSKARDQLPLSAAPDLPLPTARPGD
jgi:hypothetical protein